MQKSGIRVAYANYNTEILNRDEIKNNNKFISKEFLIGNCNQILPLYGIVAKRVEYLVIWRDYNLDLNNPNQYLEDSFKQIKEFHKRIKKLLSKVLNCKIYYVKTTELALKLLNRKKYNKIIIITNGGNDGKEFIINARNIIGSKAIAAISAIDVFRHIKNIQDIENVLVLSGLEFHEKFFKAVLNNDRQLLEDLRMEITKEFLIGSNLAFNEFNDDVFNYPNFKENGKFHELIFNGDDIYEKDLKNFINENIANDDEEDEKASKIACTPCLIA